jgi:serine/threonine-protein kinase RsbT
MRLMGFRPRVSIGPDRSLPAVVARPRPAIIPTQKSGGVVDPQLTDDGRTLDEATLPVASDGDIVAARIQGRTFVLQLGFSSPDATLVATAISELARNIVLYAERGEIQLKPLYGEGRHGVLVIARDRGPGIPDVHRTAPAGGGARPGTGCHGLCGLPRLVDECEIVSRAGEGTTIALKKWRDDGLPPSSRPTASS